MPTSSGSRPLVLSIDVGTSSVRAGLYDGRGTLLPQTEIPFPYTPKITPDGGVELGADWLFSRTAEVIDQCLAHIPRKHSIAAVGMSTFWHSLMGISREQHPITPVYLWADTRSAPQTLELHRRWGDQDVAAYHQRTGAPLHSSFWPAKLAWLRQTQPALVKRVSRWISLGEYLLLRISGEDSCSTSMASGTGLWNYARNDWDEETLKALHLSPAELSAVTDEPVQMHSSWARRWPALSGIPCFPAYGDGACANAGSGAVRASQVALTVGTSSALRTVVPQQLQATLPSGLWRYVLDPRRHLIGGALSEGGNIYRWALDTLRIDSSAPAERKAVRPKHHVETKLTASEERALARMPPDAHGLTILPFLAGERSPGWRPHANASISGLTLATTPIDILRAGLESVALRLAWIYNEMAGTLRFSPRKRPEILAGGAALRHSRLWTSIIADAIGVPVTLSGAAESSARGAALIVWERLGELNLDDAPAPRGRTFRPTPTAVIAFRKARERQSALYEALLQISAD